MGRGKGGHPGRRPVGAGRRPWSVLSGLVLLVLVAILVVQVGRSRSGSSGPAVATSSTATRSGDGSSKVPATIDYGSLKDKAPTQTLALSVLSASVVSQLGGDVTYNQAGSFIVDDNQPRFEVTRSTPYFSEPHRAANGQLGRAVAVLNRSTYEGENRSSTLCDGRACSSTINPPGWHQKRLKGSAYSTLYNRGHSLGYALIARLPGFDASEANPDNISTQTAWANQANGGVQGNGQNYYEGIVRDALKDGGTVKYLVQPLYDGADLVPSGTHIEADCLSGCALSFNVFVPNVQPGVRIDYATGRGTVVGR